MCLGSVRMPRSSLPSNVLCAGECSVFELDIFFTGACLQMRNYVMVLKQQCL